MRRRDFTIGLLVGGIIGAARAQQPAKQHRIAIVITAGPVAGINDPASRPWQAFWEELRHLGDIEGQTLPISSWLGPRVPT